MIYSYAEEVQRVAERTLDNKQAIAQMNKQRRNSVVDMFGETQTSYGDASHPATVYLSVSPDLICWSRFQLKIAIQPFMATTSSATSSASVTVNGTDLDVSGSSEGAISSTTDHQGLVELEVERSTVSGGVSPNPHTHSTTAHTHAIEAGVSVTHTTASDFRVYIDGVEVTAYLQEQHDGAWMDGEGIYPTNTIEDIEDFYDILDVAGLMYGEGLTDDYKKLTSTGFKKIEITSASPFQATVYLYCKYNYTGR